jgi:hypothetical protein
MTLFFISVLAFILLIAIVQGKPEATLLLTGLLIPLGILYFLPELVRLSFIILAFITITFVLSKLAEHFNNK